MKIVLKFLSLILLCLAGCKTEDAPTAQPPLQFFGYAFPLKSISSPERVVAYRISGDNMFYHETVRQMVLSGEKELPKLDDNKYVQTYPILSGPVEVPKQLCQQLSRMLLDRRNYQGGSEMCSFAPSVAFRFSRQQSTAEVLVSFYCGSLVIFEDGQRLLPELPIDPMHNELVRLVESILPSKEVQPK